MAALIPAVTARLWHTDMLGRKTKILSVLLAIFMSVGMLGACTPGNTGGNGDDGTGDDFDYTDLSVRDFVGRKGIVTAASPYAAKAGLDILQAGGNAFDAAVAVSFAISVAEVDASGLGGGGLMIAYNVNTGQSLFYNFREFAPAGVETDYSEYEKISADNACIETAVPTQVAGLLTILEEQGSGNLTKQQIMQPAIDMAADGIVVTPELSLNIKDSTAKILYNGIDVWNVYSDGIEGLYEGDILVQTDLAETLEYVATHTVEEFYTGEIAQKIVEASQAHGGSITMEDMKYASENYPKKSEALTGTYNGYDILTSASPSTGGTMLIEMLNMLECYDGDISALGHNSAEYINLIATVMQLTYGDKEKYMADTSFVDVPLVGLTGKEYAAERFEKYTAGKAYLGTGEGDLPYGNPYPYNGGAAQDYAYGPSGEHTSTTTFSVIDEAGNIVTITQTINNFFGCGIVPEGCGFFLNNEIRDFSYTEGSINEVAPYKQPASYMMPTVILKEGKPYATLGSPGGSRIPVAVLQVVLNMIEFGMDMQTAINQPRVYCYTTTDEPPGTAKLIEIENALKELLPELIALGYDARVYSDNRELDSYFGGVQGIRVEEEGYHGGADPRRDGKALGY